MNTSAAAAPAAVATAGPPLEPAAAAPPQSSTSSSSTSSSGASPGPWPNDTPERRRHRIAFYGKYGIDLDPTSPLSFIEQVMKQEHRIAKKTTKVVPFKTYEDEIAKRTAAGCPSLQRVSKPDADGNMTTETVWMTQKSRQCSAMGRVVHSCNVFDAMVDTHSARCASPTRGRGLGVSTYVPDLTRVLHISNDNASYFVSACPICQPVARFSMQRLLLSAAANNFGSSGSGNPSTAGSVGTLAKISSHAAAPKDCAVPSLPGSATVPAKRIADVVEIPDFSGPARNFVQQVQAMVNWMTPTEGSNIEMQMLPTDGLYDTVERLLETQFEFRHAGKPTTIDLGYHYTRKEQMQSIGKTGLMTFSERNEKGIAVVRNNGTKFGDGIYTSSNPFAYHGYYGGVGLIVARLLGSNAAYTGDTNAITNTDDSSTVQRKIKIMEVVVVSTSKQCVPILQYKTRQLDPRSFAHPGNVALLKYHTELQAIVDRVFNAPPKEMAIGRNVKAKPTIDLTLTAPSTTTAAVLNRHSIDSSVASAPTIPPASASTQTIDLTLDVIPPASTNLQTMYMARAAILVASVSNVAARVQVPLCTPETLYYQAPNSLFFRSLPFTSDLDPPSGRTCQFTRCSQPGQARMLCLMNACQHVVHRTCFRAALDMNPGCPVCSKAIGSPQGKMPGGKMKVSCERDMKCAGYEHAGTICIKYSIPQDAQKPYHPNPGAQFSSAKRTAYLPETADGCDLLKRLKYAFMHGLTFTVGVSQATGLDDSVTWSTIPHKTSMTGGPFGYPDPAYFAACHKELDNLEVPKAADL